MDGNGIGTGCGFLGCGRRRKGLTSRELLCADDGRLHLDVGCRHRSYYFLVSGRQWTFPGFNLRAR